MSKFTLLAFALVLATALGCGEQVASVSGKVTYNGQPVENGMIAFRPADGRGQTFAVMITNGDYVAPEAVPGSRKVEIRGTKAVKWALSSEESARLAEEVAKEGSTADGHVGQRADYIPADAEGNNQTVEISRGDQTMNFDLKGPPRS
jgi:hypothetical protein